MTKAERKLIADLLQRAAYSVSSYEPNWELDNTGENWALMVKLWKAADDSQEEWEERPPVGDKIKTSDSFLMYALADLLEEEE